MALTVYTSKDNQWREYVNPLRGGERSSFMRKFIRALVGGKTRGRTSKVSATLAGNAHQEAFNQVAKADAVMVSEALRRDFDKPLLNAVFPGWPVEASFELSMEAAAGMAGMADMAGLVGTGPV